MATLENETIIFYECPWCHKPGRLLARTTAMHGIFAYSIGCNNKHCPVKPRTKETVASKEDLEAAIKRCQEHWECR